MDHIVINVDRLAIPVQPRRPQPSPLMYAFAYLVMFCTDLPGSVVQTLVHAYTLLVQTLVHAYDRVTTGALPVARNWLHQAWLYANQNGDLENAINLGAVLAASTLVTMIHVHFVFVPPGGVYADTPIANDRVVHRVGKSVATFEYPVEMGIIYKLSIVGVTLNFVVIAASVAHWNERRRITSLLMLGTILASLSLVVYSLKMVILILHADQDPEQEIDRGVAVVWYDWNLRMWYVAVGVIVLVKFWRVFWFV